MNKMSIFYKLLFSFVPICLLFQSCRGGQAPKRIIYILLDACRSDRMSCYGNPIPTTPNIDKIAKEGVIFLKNYSQANVTPLSVSQIFTSRYFPKRYVGSNDRDEMLLKRQEREITIFELLKNNGYRTVVFSGNPSITPNTYLATFIDEFFDVVPQNSGDKTRFGDILLKLNDWIDNNQNEKFFCYIHAMDTHFPHFFDNKAPFVKTSSDKIINGNPKIYYDKENKYYDNNDKEYLKQIYDSDLNYVDSELGIFFNKLERLGKIRDTLIVISSDHGEELLERDVIGHGFYLYNTELLTPLIFSFPNKISKGILVDEITQNIDIFPTILDICEIEFPKSKEKNGKSLFPLIQKDSQKGNRLHDYVYSMSDVLGNNIYTIIDPRYKYISGASTNIGTLRNEFFDLIDDRNEKRNIIGQEDIKYLLPKYTDRIEAFLRTRDKSILSGFEDNARFPFYRRNPSGANPPDSYTDKVNFTGDSQTDNLWNLTTLPYDTRLVCFGPGENPKDINLEIPVPNGTYDVYIEVLNSKSLEGIPASKFKIRVQSENEFRVFCKDDKIDRAKDDIFLGRYNIKSNKFNATISAGQKTHWVYTLGFKFFPENRNSVRKDTINNDEIKNRLRTLGYIK